MSAGQDRIAQGVAAHYDQLDLFYRRVWDEQIHHGLWLRGNETPAEAAMASVRCLEQRLELAPGQRGCDVGCGYGKTAAELARRCGVEVTGITLSPCQAAAAEQGPGLRWVVGDWLANDWPSAEFDGAWAVESLEHMADPGKAIAEMVRVVKPGGKIVLFCWLRAAELSGWERRWLVEPIQSAGHLAGSATEDDYRSWLALAGARLERVEDFSRAAEPTWPSCLRRSVWGMVKDAELRRFFWSHPWHHGRLAVTLLRIWFAYAVGALRYAVFTASVPKE